VNTLNIFKNSKKGMLLGEVPGAVIMLVVVGLILTVGSIIGTDLRDDQSTGSYAYNASDNMLVGIDNVSGWQDTIGTVIGAAVVIGIVVGAFVVYRNLGE
jgi:hypothetical protein